MLELVKKNTIRMKNINGVVVTGPTGAIGVAIIERCVSEGTKVLAICHKKSLRISRLPISPLVKVIECDLDEIDRLPELINNDYGEYDVFIHLAWACTFGDSRNNVVAQIDNIRYTITALETAKAIGCKRFIGAGSQAEYGRVNETLSPYLSTNPENGYGMAKLCAGNLSRLRASQLDIEHIWVRIVSVYGPYDGENTLISSALNKLKSREHLSCTKGEQMWNYLYSKDAAKAFWLLAQKGINGKTYVLGGNENRPLKEYIEILRMRIDPDADIGYGDIPYNDKQVMKLEVDISELINDVGFRCDYSFEDGISEMLEA